MTDMTHTLDALIALAAGDDGLPDDMRADVERLRARVAAPQRESVTVRYDLSPAQTESAIRDALMRMDWTPPEGESAVTVRAERDAARAAKNLAVTLFKSVKRERDALRAENDKLRERVNELEAQVRTAGAEALETCLEIEERPKVIERARAALAALQQEGK